MAAKVPRKNSFPSFESEGEVNAFSYSGLQASVSKPLLPPVAVVAPRVGLEKQAGSEPHMMSTAVQRSRILELTARIRNNRSTVDNGVTTVVNAYGAVGRVLEFLCRQTSSAVGHVQLQLLSLLQEQLHHREISSTVMDIVLVIYALGFVALSVYHASMFKSSGYV